MIKIRELSKITLVFIYMFLLSCTNHTDKDLIKKYGIDYNSVREKIGLEPIPNNSLIVSCVKKGDVLQISYLIDSTYSDKNKTFIQSKIVKPKYLQKTIIILKGQINIEQDTYFHPMCHDATSLNGGKIKVNNQMSFEYYFTNHDGWDKGWYYILTNGSTGGISKFQADSIIHSWGLTRPVMW